MPSVELPGYEGIKFEATEYDALSIMVSLLIVAQAIAGMEPDIEQAETLARKIRIKLRGE